MRWAKEGIVTCPLFHRMVNRRKCKNFNGFFRNERVKEVKGEGELDEEILSFSRHSMTRLFLPRTLLKGF